MFESLNKEPIIVYTDGSSSNNKTRCTGWATIMKYKGHYREHWGGFEPDTTNQQTEVYSALYALQQINTTDIPVHIHSDSAYLINCMLQDWINKKWRMNGWINSKGKDVSNRSLFELLDSVAKKQLNIHWIKVKGHSGIEFNERADVLSVKGRHDTEVKLGLRDSESSEECLCKDCKKVNPISNGIFSEWTI